MENDNTFDGRITGKEEYNKKFLHEPLQLHDKVTLTNDDIDEEISFESELGQFISQQTMIWNTKKGFPTYSIQPQFKTEKFPDMPIAAVKMEKIFRFFKLKPESKALADFIAYQENINS